MHGEPLQLRIKPGTMTSTSCLPVSRALITQAPPATVQRLTLPGDHADWVLIGALQSDVVTNLGLQAQLHCDSCKTTGAACTAEILAACTSRPDCHSFARDGDRYQLYALNNWSAVPNAAWDSFAMVGPKAIAPPPPGPANNCGGGGGGHHPHPHPRPSPAPPSPPHKWGSPPALWNTLHVDGVRQVRARFPK